MKKRSNHIEQNYLEKKPVIKEGLRYSIDEHGAVTIELENKGVANRIAQFLIKKPKVSYIHLDEMGNFVWPLIDGERDITAIGIFVKEHFGEKAEPLYPRLAQYFKTLETYSFITFKD